MCSNSMASAHVILKQIRQRLRAGGYQSGSKVVPHYSKSDLPLGFLAGDRVYETVISIPS